MNRRLDEEELSPEEFERLSRTPLTEEERAEWLALIRWFMTRYPTAKERLAYARRKYAEVTAPARIERGSVDPET
jgi:hypothetical protein